MRCMPLCSSSNGEEAVEEDGGVRERVTSRFKDDDEQLFISAA